MYGGNRKWKGGVGTVKWTPLEKQNKKSRRNFYAAKRGSWNGISPATRTVQSGKIYDRNRMKQADRRTDYV